VHRPAAFDYTTVGHVTVDVLADGSRRPGGSAFYSALQAARLGQRTLILTQGAPGEIERLIEPYREEVELRVLPSPATTTLATSTRLATSAHEGEQRTQRVLAWAGQIAEVKVDTAILHLAPVARETPRAWQGRAAFVGITPQGLARAWEEDEHGETEDEHGETRSAADSEHREMRSAPVDRGAIAGGCDALVLSEHERASCAELVSAAGEMGAVVAITAGARPTTLLTPDGEEAQVAVPAIERPRDDLGAGDVFAAAFFVALAEGQPPARAAAFANGAAAVRVSGVGADAIGDRESIETHLRDTSPAPS
jgi:sugar/nucleoside kinase (ribokinase family)